MHITLHIVNSKDELILVLDTEIQPVNRFLTKYNFIPSQAKHCKEKKTS
jgi:hypothetical protein